MRKIFSVKVRAISLLLAVVILSTLFAGCTIGDGPSGGGQGGELGGRLVIATFVDLHIDEPGTEDNPNIFYYAKKKYEEETGGTVQVKLYNHTQFTSKLVTLIGSNNSPDLIYLGSGHMPKYSAMQLLQPVDDLIDIEKVNYPEAAESFVWKDEHYALRVEQVQPYMIWYNKKLFARNGLEDPYDLWKADNWGWDKFKELGLALTQDTDGDGSIDQWGFTTAGIYTAMWANGGDWYRSDSEGNVEITWKEEPFYNGLKFMQDSAGSWWTPKAGDGYSGFSSNKTAMAGYTFEFVWQYAQDMDAKDIGCVPWPKGPNFDETGGLYQAYCNLIAIAQGANNVASAIKYTEYMTELEKEMYTGYTPFGNATAEKFLTQEHWEALDYARDRTRINPTAWGDWDIGRIFFPTYNEGEDIVATLDSLEPLLRAEIDKTLAYTLPEVKEFKTPQVLSFENGEFGYLTTDGCEPGARISSGDSEAADGKTSLVLESTEEGVPLIRTDVSKLEIPTYWTYTVKFDWKVLAEADEGMGTDFYLSIRSDKDIGGNVQSIGYLQFGGLTGDTGTATATIPMEVQLDGATLIFSAGQYAGSIAIDNLEIIAD